MGIGIRQGLSAIDIAEIPYEGVILELLGTVGLIFILLGNALDLELSREKLPLILKSATLAHNPCRKLNRYQHSYTMS